MAVAFPAWRCCCWSVRHGFASHCLGLWRVRLAALRAAFALLRPGRPAGAGGSQPRSGARPTTPSGGRVSWKFATTDAACMLMGLLLVSMAAGPEIIRLAALPAPCMLSANCWCGPWLLAGGRRSPAAAICWAALEPAGIGSGAASAPAPSPFQTRLLSRGQRHSAGSAPPSVG